MRFLRMPIVDPFVHPITHRTRVRIFEHVQEPTTSGLLFLCVSGENDKKESMKVQGKEQRTKNLQQSVVIGTSDPGELYVRDNTIFIMNF